MNEFQREVPYRLQSAHQDLVRELDKAIGQVQSNALLKFSNADDVCRCVETFVDALGEFGREELQRRATILEKCCGPGSEYDQARLKVLEAFEDSPIVTAPLQVRHPPASTDVIELQERSILLLDVPSLGDRKREALEEFSGICREILREARPLEVSGCRYLYYVHEAGEADASEYGKGIKALMGGLGGGYLEPMKRAAASLMAWARENAGVPVQQSLSDSTTEASNEAELLTSGDKLGFTSDEFNVLARDFLKENHSDEKPVTARELREHLKSKNPANTCSTSTIHELPSWRTYQDEVQRRGLRAPKKASKRVVTLTKDLEATHGEADKELQRLMDEQKDDFEPSPTEDDQPDVPPQRVKNRRRL